MIRDSDNINLNNEYGKVEPNKSIKKKVSISNMMYKSLSKEFIADKVLKDRSLVAVNEVLTQDKFKDIFNRDQNDTSRVFCISCKRSYAPRRLNEHKTKLANIDQYTTAYYKI